MTLFRGLEIEGVEVDQDETTQSIKIERPLSSIVSVSRHGRFFFFCFGNAWEKKLLGPRKQEAGDSMK